MGVRNRTDRVSPRHMGRGCPISSVPYLRQGEQSDWQQQQRWQSAPDRPAPKEQQNCGRTIRNNLLGRRLHWHLFSLLAAP